MQNLSPKGRNGVIVKWIKVESRCLFLETPCVAGDFVRGARVRASGQAARSLSIPLKEFRGILARARAPQQNRQLLRLIVVACKALLRFGAHARAPCPG